MTITVKTIIFIVLNDVAAGETVEFIYNRQGFFKDPIIKKTHTNMTVLTQCCLIVLCIVTIKDSVLLGSVLRPLFSRDKGISIRKR